MRQHFAAVRRHQYVVLDSHSPPAGKVNAGLNSEDHSRLKHGVGILPDGRRLVNLQTDPVTQAMAKKLAEARLLDDGPSLGIHLLRWQSWTDGRKRLSLRLQHNSVHGLKFRRYPTARQNPRQVAIVEAPAG